MRSPATPRLMTVAEVAERLRVHPVTVRRKIDAGEFTAIRHASHGRGALRVDERELELWLKSQAPS